MTRPFLSPLTHTGSDGWHARAVMTSSCAFTGSSIPGGREDERKRATRKKKEQARREDLNAGQEREGEEERVQSEFSSCVLRRSDPVLGQKICREREREYHKVVVRGSGTITRRTPSMQPVTTSFPAAPGGQSGWTHEEDGERRVERTENGKHERRIRWERSAIRQTNDRRKIGRRIAEEC
eukprot:754142-Hanusia_phi.AAC.5